MMKPVLAFFLLAVCHLIMGQERFDIAAAQKFQTDLNADFADSTKSPLTAKDLAVFKSLDYYPIQEKFFVVAKFVRTANEKEFKMKTSTARRPIYVKYGEAHFTIDGNLFSLNIYQNIELSKKSAYETYLFLPFFDLTCGQESYSGGRYIDLKIPTTETVVIDFNKAYNPYCAYNHEYSCPKVPAANDLKIEIKAGVKKFHD